MINSVIVCGNLTRDPERKELSNGTVVATFGIAVNERDYVNYFDVTCFGGTAEAVQRYCSKGMKVCVFGKLRYSSWERDGQKRSKVEITANQVEFMSKGGAESQSTYEAPAQSAPTASEPTGASVYDEFIPF